MNRLQIFSKQLVLVVGDMMVDKYIVGTVDRISPEAPVPVLCQKEVLRKLGGAGNVIVNATSLGAGVRALGRIGQDTEGSFFRKILREVGVDDCYVFEEGSTIVKTRISASNQQFIRIDEEIIIAPTQATLSKISEEINGILDGVTVVIISDYAKGFLTEALVQLVIQEARKKRIPILVDPKGKSAAKYHGATAITPNNKEFLDLTGLQSVPSEKEIATESLRLCEAHDIAHLIFTRSEKGISVINRDDRKKNDFPAVIKEVVDVTGAGDTVVTAVALALGAGFSLADCINIANVAASIVISKFGAAQTTIEELSCFLYPQEKKQLNELAMMVQLRSLKDQGKQIVFTNGCFDLVHAGHISSFMQAKKFGDILVVGINSDESIRQIKGNARPIVDLQNRMTLLSALECVDFVISFEADTPQALIEQIKPNVLIKGKDWEGKAIAGEKFVRSYGGKIVFVELEQGLSTTSIIEKIRG